MFKVGQVWRGNQCGFLYLVIRVPHKNKAAITGTFDPESLCYGYIRKRDTRKRFTLIGNNYKPKDRSHV